MAVLQKIYTYPLKSAAGLVSTAAEIEPWGLAQDRRWMLVDGTGRFVTGRAIGELVRLQAVPDEQGLVLQWHDGSRCLARAQVQAPPVQVIVWKDQVPALSVEPATDRWLSERLGRALRLVHLADPGLRPFAADAGGDGACPEPVEGACPELVEGARPEPVEGVVSFADAMPLLAVNSASVERLSEWLGEAVDLRRFRPNLVVEGLPAFAEDRWQLLRIGSAGFRMVRRCVRCIFTTVDPDSGLRDRRREPLATLEKQRAMPEGACFGVNLMPWPAAGTGMRLQVGDRVEQLEHSL